MQGRGFLIIAGGSRFPGPWIPGTFVRDPGTGLWSNVPVEQELIVNGGFASSAGWGLGAGWSVTGGQAVGTNVVSLNSILQNVAVQPIGTWLFYSYDILTSAIGSVGCYIHYSFRGYHAPGVVGPFSGVFRTTSLNPLCSILGKDSWTGTADNLSIKNITLSSIIAIRNMGRSTLSYWGAPVTVAAPHHNGVIGWATPDLLNFICARHDGTNIVLEKCVNGVYTVLINTAAAYGAGRQVTIVREDSTHFHVKYNGSQVGATQEITDAGIISNTYFGLFSTGGGTVGDPVYA